MKTFASITISFLLILVFSTQTAFAAETESDCKPVQYVNSVDAEYVTSEILRRSYDVVREHMEAGAGETIVLRYPFNAEQSKVIRGTLVRWGLQLNTVNFEFVLRLEPRRTQLVLTSETVEIARLDFMLRDEIDTPLVFASVSTADGRSSCIEYTKMRQFFWDTVITKIVIVEYPEGLPVAME